MRKLAEMEREECRGKEAPKLKNPNKAKAIKKRGEEPLRQARPSGFRKLARTPWPSSHRLSSSSWVALRCTSANSSAVAFPCLINRGCDAVGLVPLERPFASRKVAGEAESSRDPMPGRRFRPPC